MKIFTHYKNKWDLLKELKFYKDSILKKKKVGDLNSALIKSRSALTLIKEYQEKFDLDKELKNFTELNNQITNKIKKHRDKYLDRLLLLMREKLNEENLEKLLKLLASLKSEVDKHRDQYNLQDLQNDINSYFSYLKRLYIILSSYKTLNYISISEDIYNFIQDLDSEEFPNLVNFIKEIHLKVIKRKLVELSNEYDKIKISDLSDKMQLTEDQMVDLIYKILEQPDSPIKVFNSTHHQVLFKIDK